MYCPTCGTHNDDNNFRCIQCGNILQQAPGGYGASGGAAYGAETYPEPSSATTALILVILAWAFCGIFLSIPGLIVAKKEIRGIEDGLRDPKNMGTAKAAYWLGVINIILTGFVLVIYIILIAAVGVNNF